MNSVQQGYGEQAVDALFALQQAVDSATRPFTEGDNLDVADERRFVWQFTFKRQDTFGLYFFCHGAVPAKAAA
ncbi:hypothetical protein GCM10023186_41750 [Hymenobacter koreensis]|uniref:Uncharacterized protein n=2 Tax=Hymenobacter koreensis TaxID=1084523 RepID=A0ABP8JJX5_9BACT